jgi:hypothetical protein
MEANQWVSIEGAALSDIFDEEHLGILQEEVANGITTAQHPITAFKIEQKIVELNSNTDLNAGGFANGNANIKKLTTRYYIVMFSNKFEIINSGGNQIRKRYGYGYGFTLSVVDIKTKLNFNYAIIAASAALDLSHAGYALNVNGLTDGQLILHTPNTSGNFNNAVYKSLIGFIDAAKKHLTSTPINVLYPIEVLRQINISSEYKDFLSILFSVKQVSQGAKLINAVDDCRKTPFKGKINENVLQFVYSYFGLESAYVEPSGEQRANATNWMNGTYNKVSELNPGTDSWVTIDPATDNGKFTVLTGLSVADEYKPHSVPADWATSAKSLDDVYSEASMDFSSSLKLASIADASGKFNTTTITRDISLYMDISENPAAGSKVIETRYGVGIRLSIRISNKEFGTKISYAGIGAASQLGYANIEYEIAGLGMSDPQLLADFPGPLDINENTMSEINTAFNALKTKLSAMDVAQMLPQPYMIRVNEPDKVDAMLPAQIFVFSLNKIADKAKLVDIQNLPNGVKKEDVAAIYKSRCEISDENVKPSGEQKRAAQKWLDLDLEN